MFISAQTKRPATKRPATERPVTKRPWEKTSGGTKRPGKKTWGGQNVRGDKTSAGKRKVRQGKKSPLISGRKLVITSKNNVRGRKNAWQGK